MFVDQYHKGTDLLVINSWYQSTVLYKMKSKQNGFVTFTAGLFGYTK